MKCEEESTVGELFCSGFRFLYIALVLKANFVGKNKETLD